MMFKANILAEKNKPPSERKIFFPFNNSDKENDNENTCIDIAAYR